MFVVSFLSQDYVGCRRTIGELKELHRRGIGLLAKISGLCLGHCNSNL